MDNVPPAELGIIASDVMTNTQDANKYIGPDSVPFQVSNKATRRVENIEDLEKIFESGESPKPEYIKPTITSEFSQPAAEFVPLNDVVGGAEGAKYDQTFLVSPKEQNAEGRGRQHVLEIAKSYQDGRPLDPAKPQEYYEYKGKYFVTSGRHSTAALKAMGVPQIPALVTHITKL